MTIRAWEEKDIENIANLEKECFLEEPWTKEQLQSAFHRYDAYTLLIETGGEIVAYFCGTQLFETAEVLVIAVAKKHRGKGFGKGILDAFLQEMQARKVEKVFLEVRVGNEIAKKLYESRGFTTTRLRNHYYSNGESALEMVKII